MIKLQAGKHYETRGGDITGKMKRYSFGSSPYPFYAILNGRKVSWTEGGRTVNNASQDRDTDLIKEVSAPDESQPQWEIGEFAIYKGETHKITDVDEGYGFLALGGDRYICPNHPDNNCISAPMSECVPAPEAPKEPVIEELVVKNQGNWLRANGRGLDAWMSRADFRGFKFEGFEFPQTTPWVYESSDGFMHECQDPEGTRTLVHASHVLREVPK